MKNIMETLEEAAKKHCEDQFKHGEYSIGIKDIREQCELDFCAGAEWQKKQSQWISVKNRLPNEGQRVLSGFWYYYKYADREAESVKFVTPFTYKNGAWVADDGESYIGKEVCKDDIEVVCWMPIPSFDDILEANKDVLKRMKEKGE